MIVPPLFVRAGLFAAVLLPFPLRAAPVINELMYHPLSFLGSPEEPGEEWIEIHNPDAAPADVSGWRLTRGVTFTVPDATILAAGGYLVIAADVAKFNAAYPGFAGTVVGGWTGRLGNGGEEVEFADASGTKVDDVTFADEGGWATRVRAAASFGHQGWEWEALHDGGGHTLARLVPELASLEGQNWKVSPEPGGTPGAANWDVLPPEASLFALEVRHKPEIPRSTDPIRVRATLPGGGVTNRMLLWRVAGAATFNSLPLIPDIPVVGVTWEGTATIPAQPSGTIIEYFVDPDVNNDPSVNDTVPRRARTSNPGVLPQTYANVCNYLFQVDDTFDPTRDFTVPGNQPLLRVVMTPADRAELTQLQTTNGQEDSVATFNGAFISHDGAGTSVVQNAGVRNRGFSSALGPPNNFHLSFRSDDRWRGRGSIQLNCQYGYGQVLGGVLFARAGIPPQDAVVVQFRVNGTDLAESGNRMYGRYAMLEGRGGDWAEKHYPDDADGNFYRLDDHAYSQGDPRSGEFTFEGTTATALNYTDTFFKETNREVDDWSDLIDLCRIVSAPSVGGSGEQPAIPDSDYPAAVATVLDVDHFYRYIACDALLGNQEGGLQSGRADDVSIYRGVADPLFRFVPHDLDDIFDIGNGVGDPAVRSLFSYDTLGGGLAGLPRLFRHPALVPRYYAAVLEAMDQWFNRETIDPLVDRLLQDWVPLNDSSPGVEPNRGINDIKAYVNARRANVLSQIQQNYSLTVTGNAPDSVEGYKVTTTGAATFGGSFNVARTYSVTVNGVLAQWFYRTAGGNAAGTWTLATPAGGGGVLNPGLNRVVVRFHDGLAGSGAVIHSLSADVLYNAVGVGTTLGGTLTPQGSLSLLAPSTYLPGVPVLVRVDLRNAADEVDRSAWNTTVNLATTNGVIASPSTLTLTNGMGSALVTLGGGAATTVPLFAYGIGGNGTAGSGTPGSEWKSKSDFTTTSLAAFIASSGSTWMTEGFDDSSWATIRTETGYADGDENTPIPDLDYSPGVAGSQNVPCYLFRSTFNITDVNAVASVTGQVKYDDAYRLYVNGVKVANSGGLGDAIGLNQYATAGGENASANLTVPTSFLHNGVNTIAVEVHQDDANSSDVTFDLRLSAEVSTGAADPGDFTLTASSGPLSTGKSLTSLGSTPTITAVSGPLPVAVTEWSGIIQVTGDVTVPAGGTLNIAAGTHILMAGTAGAGSTTGSDLIVATGGTVNAAGTFAQPVHITAANPLTRWGEINVGGSTSTWSHCLVSLACHSPGGGHTGTGPCFRLGNGAVWTFEDGAIADLPGKTLANTGTATISMRRSQFSRCVMGPEITGSGIVIEDCNFTHMLPQYRESGAPNDEDCIYIHDSGELDVNLRRCVFAHADDDGIDLLAGDIAIEDCIVRNIFDKGMSFLQNNVTVRRTQIIDCDFGVSTKTQIGSEGTTYTLDLENCTIVGEAHPTNESDQSGGVYWHNVGVHVRNKYGTGPNAQLVVQARNCIISAVTPMLNDYADGGVDHPLTTATYNCYHDVAGSNPVDPAPPVGTGSLVADPLFVNATARDFHLAPGSPAINAGDLALMDPDDSRSDMGALPFGSGSIGGSGTVTWAASGSPYFVTENVAVPPGLTLRVEPGVAVHFSAGVRLLVQGAIQVEGTAEWPVILSHVPGSALVPDTVLDGSPLAQPHWAGIRIEGPGTNIIRHAHFINAQGTRAANNGSVGVFNSSATIEYCTFSGTHLRMIYSSASSMNIRFNRFADMFAPNEAADALGLDNISEHVKSDNRFPNNGYFLVQGNIFGINKGHNDVVDIGSNRRPNAVAQIRDNLFSGVGDECMDLDGDFLITGNVFRKIFKDDETSDRGYASGISTSDFKPATLAVVARNIFWEVDHCLNLKSDATALFEHNTSYKVNGDFVDRFGNDVVGSCLNLFIDENGPSPGTGSAYPGIGAYAGHNIFAQVPRIFGNADPNANPPELPTDWTHHLEFDDNLIDPAMTDFSVGPRHPGSVMDLGPGNRLGAALFRDADAGDFALRPGSPAIGASPFGQDLGAVVPDTVWVRADIPAVTGSDSASFLIGGPAMFGYRYRLDGGPWSAEAPVGNVTNVLVAGSDTRRTATLALNGLANGPHTLEVIGRDFADVWQPESSPTVVTWTVDSSLVRIVISEILARNVSVHNNGGTFPDFIEICNEGASAVDLAGYRLSDDPLQPDKFVFPSPTIVVPGSCVLVHADGPSAAPGLHADFGLSAEGEQVILRAPAGAGGAVVDAVAFGLQVDDLSIGRIGRDGVWALAVPTPGVVPNTPAPLGDSSGVIINEWLASGGIRYKEDWIELANLEPIPASLAGMVLTDARFGSSVAFPPLSFIGGNGYVKIIADGDPSAGSNHTAFRIDGLTEELLLISATGAEQDYVRVFPQVEDVSQGRVSEGGVGGYGFFTLATGGAANGTDDPGYANAVAILDFLRITEIMFHADGGNDYEFIELTNTGLVDLDLGGVRFFEGITFTFPPGFLLGGGEEVLLVRNPAVFKSRYGSALNVAGAYSGNLDNSGETLSLRLAEPWDANVLCFRYGATWHATNGTGRSLTLLRNSTGIEDFDEPESWVASTQVHGDPDSWSPPADPHAESLDAWLSAHSLAPGDLLVDTDFDGLLNLLEFALNTDPRSPRVPDGADRLPTAGTSLDGFVTIGFDLPTTGLAGGHGCPGVTYEVTGSNDLQDWTVLARKTPAVAEWTDAVGGALAPGTVATTTLPGGKTRIVVKDQFPIDTAGHRYLRLGASVTP